MLSSFCIGQTADDIEDPNLLVSSDTEKLRDTFDKTDYKPGEHLLVVDLNSLSLSGFEADDSGSIPGKPRFEIRCNPGKESGNGKDFPTPTTYRADKSLGYTTVIQKDQMGYSKQYDTQMPYCLRLDFKGPSGANRGICIHSGAVGNYAASHGCVRVSPEHAKQVFNFANVGTKVYIIGSATMAGKFETDADGQSISLNPEDYLFRDPKKKTVCFKVQLPNPDPKDIQAFKRLFFSRKLLSIDYIVDDNWSMDKNLIRFRFEQTYTPPGTGIPVSEVERLVGKTVRLQPPAAFRQRMSR